MHCVVFVPVFLLQQPDSMDGISGAASLNEIALIGCDGASKRSQSNTRSKIFIVWNNNRIRR